MRFLEEYGVYTFSNEILKEKLSKKILDDIENSISKNKPLSDKSVYLILDVIKNWALENNARCFSHWFSPFEILETEKPKKIEVNADKYDINKQVSFLENTYKNLLK